MSWWMWCILAVVFALAGWFAYCYRQAWKEHKAEQAAKEKEAHKPQWKGASPEWKARVRALERKHSSSPPIRSQSTPSSTLADTAASPVHAESLPSSGDLRFIYEDSHGSMTHRHVSNWNNDGIYIKGYCHSANAVRTFRRDRVIDFLEGESLLGQRADVSDDGPAFSSGPAMEIVFTGFSSDDRVNLEADAEAAGLTVRKTVTKNLMFVCAGPRAGATKLSKARAQGCTILREDDFHDMLTTGEVPCV